MSFPALLLACSIKATVILLFARLAVLVTRRCSAALRHQIWAVAIVCTIALPAMQLLIPGWHAIHSTAAVQLWRSAAPGAAPALDSTLNAMRVTAGAGGASHGSQWIFVIWLAGCACVVLRLLAGLGRLMWISSRATPLLDFQFHSTPELLIAREAGAMPCTWGFRNPRILLPAGCETWSHERRTVVLTHELAHISRGDWPVRLMAECARALYWFHPLAWMAVKKLSAESELACDDAVLSSGVRPDRYAGELLDLVRTASSRQTLATALAVARTTNFERRLTAMLDSTLDRRRTTRRSVLFTATTALVVLLPLAALRAPGQETPGSFTGAVFDAKGAALSNATIILTNIEPHTREMTVSDAAGAYKLNALTAGDYDLTVMKPGFEDYDIPHVAIEGGRETAQNVTLQTGEPAPPKKHIRIGGGVASSNLIHQAHPEYPADAKAARIQGAVTLDALISNEGAPEALRVADAQTDPALARAAVEAVSQWRYKPVLLNGEPISFQTAITVNFTLSN